MMQCILQALLSSTKGEEVISERMELHAMLGMELLDVSMLRITHTHLFPDSVTHLHQHHLHTKQTLNLLFGSVSAQLHVASQ